MNCILLGFFAVRSRDGNMEFTVIIKLSYKAMVQQRKWEKILYFQNPIRLNKGFSGIKMLLKKIHQ